MHIHILGICGTFMGGIAVLAKQQGHKVTGSDLNVYPPMSTQLEAQGIELVQGYDPAQLDPAPDMVVIGNAMSRGNPCVEYVLDRNLPYTSGPEWLRDNVLQQRWVIGVAGTHGKTTTSSMVAWILEHAGLEPGFLIGGVPGNFPFSARLGKAPFFVIEADEYVASIQPDKTVETRYEQGVMVSMVDAGGKLIPEQGEGSRSVEPCPVVIRKGLDIDKIMMNLSDHFNSWNYRQGEYY